MLLDTSSSSKNRVSFHRHHLVVSLFITTLFFLLSKDSVFGFQPSSSSSSSTRGRSNKVGSLSSSTRTTTTLKMTMKASINMAMSVDGYIATKDGGVDWLNNQPPPGPDEGDFGFADFLNSIDVIIMGKNSFNKVVSFGKDMYAYGDKKIVVWTRDPSSVTIPDYLQEKNCVTISSLNPKSLLEKLSKDDGCKHAYIDGGITIQKFLEAKLIQHMSITRVPILLGSGIPLFGNNDDDTGGQQQLNLTHIETNSYSNGFVTSKYDVIY